MRSRSWPFGGPGRYNAGMGTFWQAGAYEHSLIYRTTGIFPDGEMHVEARIPAQVMHELLVAYDVLTEHNEGYLAGIRLIRVFQQDVTGGAIYPAMGHASPQFVGGLHPGRYYECEFVGPLDSADRLHQAFADLQALQEQGSR
jgi:hypothetical protein